MIRFRCCFVLAVATSAQAMSPAPLSPAARGLLPPILSADMKARRGVVSNRSNMWGMNN